MKKDCKIALTRLKEVLHYDAASGLFRWKIDSGSRGKKGSIAGGLNKQGYVTIGVDGVRFLAHRLAWFYCNGEWPDRVDHKDQIRHHNWIDNLRAAEHCQNLWNSAHRKWRTLPKGVSRNGTRYCARIYCRRKVIRLGNFRTIEAAAAAYIEASKKYHGEFSIYT